MLSITRENARLPVTCSYVSSPAPYRKPVSPPEDYSAKSSPCVCVKKQSVGKDYSFNPLIPEEEIQFPESRVSEALAAGQSGIHHASRSMACCKAASIVLPTNTVPLYLGLVQMNITHFAIQIAQGGKPGKCRRAECPLSCALKFKISAPHHNAYNQLHFSGIQLRNQLAQFFWRCIGIHCPHPPDRVKGKVFYSICEWIHLLNAAFSKRKCCHPCSAPTNGRQLYPVCV